ncbi:MAG: DUF262 domain-containing protein [Desulfurellaceae bacterium]|nr:DUF262 domain-containing protein [Desulfurellaceae bacterium]
MSDGQPSRTIVSPEVIFLGHLVERIMAGKIRVPRFQRPFVWKQADLHALLDSVLRGFPIGSILVWETEQPVETTEYVGPVAVSREPGGVVGYLLDGQQRVSTLVGTLQLPDGEKSIIHDVEWCVYCDLDNGDFLREPTGGVKPHHFPVRSLLNTAGFFAACHNISSKVDDENMAKRWLDQADRLANAFRNYQIPLVRIREADIDSAIAVFARLNRTGRKMTADQMVSALTYQEGQFHLADNLDQFQEELEGKGFGNLDRVFLLRAILAALGLDIYAKEWANLVVKTEVRDKLPAAFEEAKKGITRALDFLKDLGVTSDRLLPYGLQLVMLGEFFRLCPQPDANVVALLKRWFWVTSFTGWFGGVNTTQATRALSEIRDLAEGRKTGVSVVDLDARAQAFPERFDSRSARVRAFLLYLTSLRPLSLCNDEEHLDPGYLLSARGTRAVGYVTSSLGAMTDLFSSPANRMFIDEDQVGQSFTRLADLGDDHLIKLLPTHGFPMSSIHQLQSNDRVSLIQERQKFLIEDERKFMRERSVHLPTAMTAASVADSETSDEE